MSQKQILCFGDSNTYGLIPATKERYDYNERWTGILDRKVRKYGYRIAEEGLCGRTTIFDDPFREGRRGTALLPVILETHAPIDMIIVMLGTNDCKCAYDASAHVIGLGIKKIIDQIRTFDPKIEIVLVSPIELGKDIWNGFDPEFDQRSVEISKQLGDIYEKIAQEEHLYFVRASDYAVPSVRDREHMSVDGHRKLACGLYETLRPYIENIDKCS